MSKDYLKAALMRAWHAVWETAAATAPTSIVITPAMIQYFDTSIFYIVLAWIATALIAGILSFIKSMAAGMPEAEAAVVIDALHDAGEPEDLEDAFFDEEDEAEKNEDTIEEDETESEAK